MKRLLKLRSFTLGLALSVGLAPHLCWAITEAETAFFETKIRPVLVAECYDCHDAKKQKGGLRLDFRGGWQKGGDSGDVILPGKIKESLLLQSIRHEDPDLKMPSKAPKLDAKIIADFEQWISMGAPDPRDEPPKPEENKSAWPQLLAARRGWWALQPIAPTSPPETKPWSTHPVDRFLLEKMEEHQLTPAAGANPRVLLRRLNFTLIGLPPAPEELDAFEKASSQNPQAALEQAIDRLLASPQFGEHWARHWMDLMRYAESHGSEGDPEIPKVWRYRDYLIRAFNADVPCDQLIREHLAGDLLKHPRLNPEGWNESILGTANLRMVEHGFQPIDTLDDQVKAVDNQIDVVTKAFQGLTVSCARCHDHKFDAISQRDYYALYGIFSSCRPAQITLQSAPLTDTNRGELEVLHKQIQDQLATAWLRAVPKFGAQFQEARDLMLSEGSWQRALIAAKSDPNHPLWPWVNLSSTKEHFTERWAQWSERAKTRLAEAQKFNQENTQPAWDLSQTKQWFRYGSGLKDGFSQPGEFSIEPTGQEILSGIYPAGVMTHRLSNKHNGIFTSPRFKIETGRISVRAFGEEGSMVRLIVDNYPLGINPIFPKATLEKDTPGWITLDTEYRKGSFAYLEFGTRNDLTRPIPTNRAEKDPSKIEAFKKIAEEGRSYFGVQKVVFLQTGAPKEEPLAIIPLLEEAGPKSPADLANFYQEALTKAINAWRDHQLTEPQRALLDSFVRAGLLPTRLDELPELNTSITEYRRLEEAVPILQHAPGVIETAAHDAPMMPRGDHKKPGELVPRAYLEVLGGKPFQTTSSGRQELADAIANDRNPLTSRVMANRLWHWIFGNGLVPTVDNFGRMGEQPTHPQLLEFLAAHFLEQRWSIKEMIRFLVTSKTFAMASDPSDAAKATDPSNQWLSHMRMRRLDAEPLRDSLLQVSGRLDSKFFGPPIDASAPRRSVYLVVRRNSLNAFLGIFDSPKPFTTLGRRDVTNVPGQALALLNDSFVIQCAKSWAIHLIQNGTDPEARIRAMTEMALGRKPEPEELSASLAYLQELAECHHVASETLMKSQPVWQDFAQALFNLKEFIYIQ